MVAGALLVYARELAVTKDAYLQIFIMKKIIKNPSFDVLALRSSVLLSWLCASEQAPAQATTSPHVAMQRKTSAEAKTPLRYAPLKKAAH